MSCCLALRVEQFLFECFGGFELRIPGPGRDKDRNKPHSISFPYLSGVPEKLRRIFQKHQISGNMKEAKRLQEPNQVQLLTQINGINRNGCKPNMLWPKSMSGCCVLVCLFLDTLSVLARTVGKDAFGPLSSECVQLGLNLTDTIDDPDLRRCTYVASYSHSCAGGSVAFSVTRSD